MRFIYFALLASLPTVIFGTLTLTAEGLIQEISLYIFLVIPVSFFILYWYSEKQYLDEVSRIYRETKRE